MHYTEYDTRLAAYAVITETAGNVLLSHYNGQGHQNPCWTLPGGGVGYDEELAPALVREVLEETGFDAQIGRLLTVRTYTDPQADRPFKAVQLVYLATIVGGTLGTTEIDGSTDVAAWYPISALPEPRSPLVDVALSALIRTH